MNDDRPLFRRIEAMDGIGVACVGDVMLDEFLYGTIERISPEAPVPVIRVQRAAQTLGGAGNVVRNLAALGAHGRLIAAVGDDSAAGEIDRLLVAEPRVTHGLVVEAGRTTTVKSRYVAGSQQVLRADRESVRSLSPAARRSLFDAVRTALDGAVVLVLSDYDKGVLHDGVAAELIGIARAAGVRVIVDPKGRDYGRYRGADVVTPNRPELSEVTGEQVATPEAALIAARVLLDRHGFGAVLATLGADGMVFVTSGGGSGHLPAEAREVFDVSGAGDTVVAALAAMLAAGSDLAQAARFANAAAGIVVGKVGTAVTTRDEILEALRREEVAGAEHKIRSLGSASDRVAVWRRKALRVGFTNGCFDLLHPGHISLLRQARQRCDRLVVGLNTDESVRRLKGPSRPVQTEWRAPSCWHRWRWWIWWCCSMKTRRSA
jgi:D-alpha,beta-D-heptose 7-phosphate 1-kinase (EC 2.7.1.-)/D-beta-D-heptose 1-phosphate adenylyltransferase (EC 2.7.7.-)